jgi:glutamine amidotransferase
MIGDSSMIVIVDVGMGNLGSIQNMLHKIRVPTQISSDPAVVEQAEKIILPGVGAFDNAIDNLTAKRLVPVLNKRVLEDKVPILGICLGMQLLTRNSEEGKRPGLSWISAKTVRFRFDGNSIKIPHMGWNTVKVVGDQPLFRSMGEEPRFYFVHSYHVVCDDQSDIMTTTSYGVEFVSSVHRGNIFGTQFHPEKSHKFGMQLLKNFSEMH